MLQEMTNLLCGHNYYCGDGIKWTSNSKGFIQNVIPSYLYSFTSQYVAQSFLFATYAASNLVIAPLNLLQS
jgi:hypothetical protein